MGGPKIDWRAGRADYANDKNVPPNGRLPDALQGASHLRDVFYRMGFNDREIVVLSGAHCLGRFFFFFFFLSRFPSFLASSSKTLYYYFFFFLGATPTEVDSGVPGLVPPFPSPMNTTANSWRTPGLSRSGMDLSNTKVNFVLFSFLLFYFVCYTLLFCRLNRNCFCI